VLPAAGNLTGRESAEDSLAPTQNGIPTPTGSEKQNKCKVRGGKAGQVKAWEKEGWTKPEKNMRKKSE